MGLFTCLYSSFPLFINCLVKNMVKSCLAFILLPGFILLQEQSYAQTPSYQWAFNIGDSLNNHGNSIVPDGLGNVYVTGSFTGTADFDPGAGTANLTSAGSRDIFIAKYSVAGVYQWAFRIGGTWAAEGLDITLDGAGNIYVTGRFGSTADFDPGAGIAMLSSAGSFDIFVAKYSTAGAYQWAINMGGTDQDVGISLSLDGAGNVYVTGGFSGPVDFDPGIGTANLTSSGISDIFVAKYSAAGAYQWAFRLGGNNIDTGWSIAVDGIGNVHVTGFFSGTADFDPGAGTANLVSASVDVFVAKYNAAGAYQWAFSIGGTGGGDEGKDIALDGSGNVYVTGSFTGTADFDPGAGTANLTSAGSRDIFIAKYTAGGAYLWAFNIGSGGGDLGQAITLDGSANVYVTGYFQGSADFDPGAGTTNLVSTGGTDVFVSKYNAAGAYQWAFNVGSGGNNSLKMGIAIDGTANIYVAGALLNTADFDPGTGVANLTSAGLRDIFIAKYGPPLPPGANFAAGTTTICEGTAINFTDSSSNFPTAWDWSFPGGTPASSNNQNPVITYNAPGIYDITLIASNTNGSDTLSLMNYIIVNPNPSPVITANGPTTFCAGDSVVLSSNYSSGNNWNNAMGTTQDITITTGGNYTVTVTDTNGCAGISASVNVIVNPNTAPVITAVGPVVFCDGDSVILTSGIQTVIWSPGNYTTSGITVYSSATYTVTDTSGCSGTSAPVTVTVNPNPAPAVTANGPTTFCIGDNVVLSSNYNSDNNWNNAMGTTQDITVTTGGSYTVTVTDNNGCEGTSAAITVTVHPLPAVGISPLSVCKTDPAFVMNNGTPTGGTYSGTGVSAGVFDPSIAGTGTHNIIYSYSDTNACSNTATGIITVMEKIIPIILSTDPYCENFPADTLSGDPAGGLWNGPGIVNGTAGIFDPTVAGIGNHQVIYTTPGTCGGSDTINIPVYSNPVINAGPDQTISQGEGVALNGTGSYTWWPHAGLSCINCPNPIASPAQTTTYYLETISPEGCRGIDSMTVFVEITEGELFIPNMFSPNGDGLNDEFLVHGSIQSMQMIIYNRWGQKVFETGNQLTGWDGTFEGKPLAAAVFVYYLKVVHLNSKEETRQGNVTLVR